MCSWNKTKNKTAGECNNGVLLIGLLGKYSPCSVLDLIVLEEIFLSFFLPVSKLREKSQKVGWKGRVQNGETCLETRLVCSMWKCKFPMNCYSCFFHLYDRLYGFIQKENKGHYTNLCSVRSTGKISLIRTQTRKSFICSKSSTTQVGFSIKITITTILLHNSDNIESKIYRNALAMPVLLAKKLSGTIRASMSEVASRTKKTFRN